MKKIIYAATFLFTISGFSQSKLTSAQWQQDLRYLQEKVHNEYEQLFFKVTEERFDEAVEALYAKIPDLQDHEIKVGFAEIVALFGYGHTFLGLTSWRHNEIINFHQLPVKFYWFEDGIYVQGLHKQYQKALGAKVLKIGNKSIEEVLEAIKPVVSVENDQFFKAFGINYLGVPEVLHAKGIIKEISSVPMTLEINGKEFDINFSAQELYGFPGYYGLIQTNNQWLDVRSEASTPLWLKNLDRKYYFEYLADKKIIYVRQSEIMDDPNEDLPNFYARVFKFVEENEVERFILDLRLNSGGDNHKNKPVVTGLIKSEKINQKGRLFVVLGRRTFSAAQNLVNEIENYTEAIFVGEPTAENVNFYGDSREEVLPNSKLPVRLSWAWWQDKNPRDTRQWTAPDIAVNMTFADYVSNNDPVLSAIELASEVELKMGGLMMSENIQEFKKYVMAYVDKPKYGFYNFGGKINTFGYRLVNLEKYAEAVEVFELNTKLFPNSANNWDSLAEGYWRLGNIIKAKEYYNKAIQLDKNGRVAENARNMLRRIGS